MSARSLLWPGGSRLDLVERATPGPGARDVTIRVDAAGICATDLHIMEGRFPVSPPRVFGHEVAGTVETVGQDVTRVRPGQRVVIDPMITCGACAQCRANRQWLCQAGGELGTTGGDGGWTERLVVGERNLHILPDHVTSDVGALIEPLDCVMGAFERANPGAGEGVLVFGSGPAGLLFVLLARAAGCGPIVVVGGGASRLRLAQQLGATAIFPHREANALCDALACFPDPGPDIAVEASGAAAGDALRSVRRGGRVVLYGISGSSSPNIVSDDIVSRDLSLVTGIGNTHLWPKAVAFAADHVQELTSFVTAQLPLDNWQEGLSLAADPEASIKIVFHPQEHAK